MPDYNELFCYGPRGWMWMPSPVPVAPAWWQLVPVETAKPKEPEKVFAFGSEGPQCMPPPGFKWQLVEAKKEEKKADEKKEEKKKEKPPEIVLTVPMCCEKCEEKVKERILDVHGVMEVKTDRQNSKVTVVGKADKSQVLKKAKKFNCRAKILEVKKLVETKKEEKKKEEKKPDEKKEEKKKEKPPEIVLKVWMCCGKCEEKVKEEIRDLHGVTDVKTDREKSKVTVVGKADESQVLKKAKKVDRRAKVLEVKKGEVAEKKVEEKKKEEPKKKEEKKEEPNTTWTSDPRYYYPTFYPPYHYPYPAPPPPPFGPDGSYRPSQAYPPHYYPYPETDYSYYNYPNNPHYLTHIRHS
ncbi:unnamed protein product [Sphagnum jensenii]